MADKMATREAYGKALVELGKKYDNLVVMDADLSGSTKTAVFAKEYPERFFNMGIAEQNMYAAVCPCSFLQLQKPRRAASYRVRQPSAYSSQRP